MQNNSDKFESTQKNPFFSQKKKKNDNFFMLKDSIDMNFSPFLNKGESYRRLNDYDSKILEEDAYKNVSDELFKLEYKISKLEDELKVIDSQIQAARDICDYDLITTLTNKKQLMEDEYKKLSMAYNDKSLSAKITESLSSVFRGNLKTGASTLSRKLSSLVDSLLLVLPKPFAASVKLKKSLNKLENINRSVDELIGLSPNNDGFNKYEQLSKYIVKANNIQSEMKKFIND